MDQLEFQRITNQNEMKGKMKGQINIQNWITQQAEQSTKINQIVSSSTNQHHYPQNHSQSQSSKSNVNQHIQNQQQIQKQIQLTENQATHHQQNQFKNNNVFRDEATNPKTRIIQSAMNQRVEQNNINQNHYNNDEYTDVDDVEDEENKDDEMYEQNQDNKYPGQYNNVNKKTMNQINGQYYNNDVYNNNNNQMNKQNNNNFFKSNKPEYKQQEDDNKVQMQSNKQDMQIKRQDQNQQKGNQGNDNVQNSQHPMNYERGIQIKLQQQQNQNNMQLQQQDLRQNPIQIDQEYAYTQDQQSFSQDYSSSYKQNMKVEIIERQFQKSVPNKIYTFPRKFSDSDDYSNSEEDSSFESLTDVTEYDLNSQNLPKEQKPNVSEQMTSQNKELDSLQKSFQNSLFYIINNQIGSIQQTNLQNPQPNYNQYPQQQIQQIQNKVQNQNHQGQQQQQQSLQQQKNNSNHLNFLSSSNLLSEQTNGQDTYTSQQDHNVDNHIIKSQKINGLIDGNKIQKNNQDNVENKNFKPVNKEQTQNKDQQRVIKKVIQEGGIKFQNPYQNAQIKDIIKKNGTNQSQKVCSFNFDKNEKQMKPQLAAEPLTVEDYNFDEDEDDNENDQCNYKNYLNDDNNSQSQDNQNQTKGDFDRRLKTEGNDLHNDEDPEEIDGAHKLYENTESEISDDVVRIPLTSQIQNNNINFGNQNNNNPESRNFMQFQQDSLKSNDIFINNKLDFTKQKIISNNNASSISGNFNSTGNNSNKNFNFLNGAISTNSQTSNAYHSVNGANINQIDSTTANKQIINIENNEFNPVIVKQNIQRPSSSLQGTTTSSTLNQTQKKKKQQVRLMETLKMTVNNPPIFNNQSQNMSQFRQQGKTLIKSKENVSASMNCNTISELIKKKEISKTQKKQPSTSQVFTNKRETPSQQSKQRQTVYTSMGSINTQNLVSDQSHHNHNNFNNNNIHESMQNVYQDDNHEKFTDTMTPSNPLPSNKIVKRSGSQQRETKLRNHRLKTDSSNNPLYGLGNQTTANINNNYTQLKQEKSRERTASASKKKTAVPTNLQNSNSNNIYTSQFTSSINSKPLKSSIKSASQVEKFKKDLITLKSTTYKPDKTPTRNKPTEQNSNKNTASKKTNLSINNYENKVGQSYPINQSTSVINQPIQQTLQQPKLQDRMNQINQSNQQNIIHKYSSSPDNYISQTTNNQQQQIYSSQNYHSIQQHPNQLSQPLMNNYFMQQQQQQIYSNHQQIQQSSHQQPSYQQIQLSTLLDNPQQQQQQQQLNNYLQQQTPQSQHIQQILSNAQSNLIKQNLQNNLKNNLRQVSPNFIDNDKNRLGQNKLYQQAKSSLGVGRNDEDNSLKQIPKNHTTSYGPGNLTKKATVVSSIDKISKVNVRTAAFGKEKLKTRIKTEPGDYDDSSLIFNNNRNNSSKSHVSPQLNSFLVQEKFNIKTDIPKNHNLSQNRANKSTTRTRNKQGEKCITVQNDSSMRETSAEKEQNNALKVLIMTQKRK